MSSFQRLAAVTDASANLIVQLRELNELRERVRKAELARRTAAGRPAEKERAFGGLNPEAAYTAVKSIAATDAALLRLKLI
jgi:hypothetical protein